MKRRKLLQLLLVMALPRAGSAEPPLVIIELHSRSAEELLPILRPLAGTHTSLLGKDRQLFLRAAPERVEELRQLIERLDRPARQLMISLYQGRLSKHDLAVLGIQTNTRNDQHPVRVKRKRTRSRLDATHTLRATEGHPAFIATGTDRPLPFSSFSASPGGISYFNGTAYRASRSGFYVLPRIAGDQVTLEINPFAEQDDDLSGGFAVQSAHTRLSGHLGEWIDIGGVSHVNAESEQAIVSRGSTRRREDRRMLLKVEAIHSPIAP